MLIQRIEKMSEEFTDIYILDNENMSFPKTESVSVCSRVLNKKQYNNLYIIEPHCLYKVKLKWEFNNSLERYLDYLRQSGILVFNFDSDYFYFINITNNLVYLSKEVGDI